MESFGSSPSSKNPIEVRVRITSVKLIVGFGPPNLTVRLFSIIPYGPEALRTGGIHACPPLAELTERKSADS